jgi:hypothetical protein
MKVLIKESVQLGKNFLNPGTEADLPEKQAKDLIKIGVASNAVSNKNKNSSNSGTSNKAGAKRQSKA